VLLVCNLVIVEYMSLHMSVVVGTLLASGSDDLKVVILDWIRSKTYITFDSGHRANVFQVSHCC